MPKNKIKHQGTSSVVILVFLSIAALLAFFPFYNVVIVSFAKFKDIVSVPFYIIPKSIDFSSFQFVLSDHAFLSSFCVSLFVTVVGVAFNMFLSTSAAYALSKKNMPGRNVLMWLIIFTMFFNGGLVPYFLLMKQIGLMDNLLSMVLPVGINTFYMIIMKNYFLTISPSLEESAKIDGANDIYILYKIVIPISAPFIATFCLFYAVDRWNEWYNALLFISDPNKEPLQIYLRNILIDFSGSLNAMALIMLGTKTQVYPQSLQMACIVVATLPIMVVYPFLQKYFVKGIMVGSIKD
jgi:putative aldouronate transport system permease protein